MHIQNLVKFCPFYLKILSGNENLTLITGHHSDTNLRKMTGNNLNLDLIISMHKQNLMKFYPFVLRILSGNEILTSIKDHNSITNLRKMKVNNPKLDIVNTNAHTTFGRIQSICSQDIGRKLKSDINQGQYLCYKFAKNVSEQSQTRSCQYQCTYKIW